MELKARLASLENQINSLQNALQNDENIINYNYRNNSKLDNNSTNLKSILMRLKMEHQAVLQNIEKALEIVEDTSNSASPFTPERVRSSNCNFGFGSPQSPNLRDKINNAIQSSPLNLRRLNSSAVITSSPLSPAVEKSHITFDILNELELDNQNTLPPAKQRKVHLEGEEEEMSVASWEYLKKYGLL